jgi:parvulin-like peptidyl-prolyl isomerase
MLKTISAALLAASVLVAPALAAAPDKNAQAPTNKAMQAPVIKSDQAKSNKALNANAKMNRHHKSYRHQRHHKHMSALKTHATPKSVVKQNVNSAAKRG